jgi:hypothetical protein
MSQSSAPRPALAGLSPRMQAGAVSSGLGPRADPPRLAGARPPSRVNVQRPLTTQSVRGRRRLSTRGGNAQALREARGERPRGMWNSPPPWPRLPGANPPVGCTVVHCRNVQFPLREGRSLTVTVVCVCVGEVRAPDDPSRHGTDFVVDVAKLIWEPNSSGNQSTREAAPRSVALLHSEGRCRQRRAGAACIDRHQRATRGGMSRSSRQRCMAHLADRRLLL